MHSKVLRLSVGLIASDLELFLLGHELISIH